MNREDELRSELEKCSGTIRWLELYRDLLDNSIVEVDLSLAILDVALACALDQTVQFESWLSNGLIKRPEEINIENWNKENPLLYSVIVKPFVFVQEIRPH